MYSNMQQSKYKMVHYIILKFFYKILYYFIVGMNQNYGGYVGQQSGGMRPPYMQVSIYISLMNK